MPDFKNSTLTLAPVVLKEKLTKASDPNTHPSILDELADFPDIAIKNAVSMNPATALTSLMKLMGHGLNIHSHPIFTKIHGTQYKTEHPLLHPTLYQHDDPEIASGKLQNLLKFASHPSASQATIRIMIKHPNEKVVAATLKNPSITPETLFSLMSHPSSYVRNLVAGHPLSSGDLLSQMVTNSEDSENKPERATLATNSKTPAEALRKLANDSNAWIRKNVANNEQTPTDVLSKLAFDENSLVKSSVLKHKNTPAYILGRMAYDVEPAIRCELAKSDKTPGNVLEKLATDPNAQVRRFVASNLKTSSIVLDKMVNDADPRVRKAIANNANASEQAIEQIKSEKYSTY